MAYGYDYRFDNFAKKFEKVLLVEHVPARYVELLTGSDFPSGHFPIV